MRRLLLAMFLSFLSYFSLYAPIISDEAKEIKQNLTKRTLLVKEFPAIAKIDISIKFDLKNLPLISPIDTNVLNKVNSEFGYRKHPVLGLVKHHNGIDIDCPIGTKVYSTANGIVEKIEISKFGYGNCIIINHGNGYKTRYAHLKEIYVYEGEVVDVENIIGTSGRTGLTTGPHLHYEVIKDNKPIDPIELVTSNKNEYIAVLKRIQQYESNVV